MKKKVTSKASPTKQAKHSKNNSGQISSRSSSNENYFQKPKDWEQQLSKAQESLEIGDYMLDNQILERVAK